MQWKLPLVKQSNNWFSPGFSWKSWEFLNFYVKTLGFWHRFLQISKVFTNPIKHIGNRFSTKFSWNTWVFIKTLLKYSKKRFYTIVFIKVVWFLQGTLQEPCKSTLNAGFCTDLPWKLSVVTRAFARTYNFTRFLKKCYKSTLKACFFAKNHYKNLEFSLELLQKLQKHFQNGFLQRFS